MGFLINTAVVAIAIAVWFAIQCDTCCRKSLFGGGGTDVTGASMVVLITGASSGIGAELALQVLCRLRAADAGDFHFYMRSMALVGST
jgi:hypothetical protein